MHEPREMSPAGERRLKRALGLSDDATTLEVLAACHELRADGFEVVKRSELDALREAVREARADAADAKKATEAIRSEHASVLHDLLMERHVHDVVHAAAADGWLRPDELSAVVAWAREDPRAAMAAITKTMKETK